MEVYTKVTQNELVEEVVNGTYPIKEIELVESLDEVAKSALEKAKCKFTRKRKIPYNKVHIQPTVLQNNSGFIINLRKRLAVLNQTKHRKIK
jgi:hypothetical protein